MTRTTKQDLHELARVISNATGEPYTVEWAYDRPRLYRQGGSVEVSPRLPPGQLSEWMQAYLKGLLTPRVCGASLSWGGGCQLRRGHVGAHGIDL